MSEQREVSSSQLALLRNTLEKTRNNELKYAGWVSKLAKKGSKPQEENYFLVVANYTLFGFIFKRDDVKVDVEMPILEIKKMKSHKAAELSISSSAVSLDILADDADEIITAIRYAHVEIWPSLAHDRRFKLDVVPPSRLERIPIREHPQCGGFPAVYSTFCHYYNTPERDDVRTLTTSVYPLHNIRVLNLNSLDQPLSLEDTRPIMEAMRHNLFFTSIRAKDIKLDSASINLICDVFKENSKVEELVLSGIGASKELSVLASSITSNSKVALAVMDFSSNSLDEKLLKELGTAIATMKHGLKELNLSKCGIPGPGFVSFITAVKKNAYLYNTLSCLVISGNKLENDGSKELASWLAATNHLKKLAISEASPILDVILVGMVKGTGFLQVLDISNNKANAKDSAALVKLIESSRFLEDLNLSGCHLTTDMCKEILKALTTNKHLKDIRLNLSRNKLELAGAQLIGSMAAELINLKHLDLTENDFGDEGVQAVAEGLVNNTTLHQLCIGKNLTNKAGKAKTDAIEAVNKLINESKCPLSILKIEGAKNLELKNDIIPFLQALSGNISLTELDISAHEMGNKGAYYLGKALQINRSLKIIHLDDNRLGASGFESLRIGMERNRCLTKVSVPVRDVSSSLKSAEDETTIRDIFADIQKYLLRNQMSLKAPPPPPAISPRTIVDKTIQGELTHLQSLASRVKLTSENSKLLEVISKVNELLSSMSSIREKHTEALKDALSTRLEAFVDKLWPLLEEYFMEVIGRLVAALKEKYKSLDSSNVQSLQDSLIFVSKRFTKDLLDLILVTDTTSGLTKLYEEYLTSVIITIVSGYCRQVSITLRTMLGEAVKPGRPKASLSLARLPHRSLTNSNFNRPSFHYFTVNTLKRELSSKIDPTLKS